MWTRKRKYPWKKAVKTQLESSRLRHKSIKIPLRFMPKIKKKKKTNKNSLLTSMKTTSAPAVSGSMRYHGVSSNSLKTVSKISIFTNSKTNNNKNTKSYFNSSSWLFNPPLILKVSSPTLPPYFWSYFFISNSKIWKIISFVPHIFFNTQSIVHSIL